jgi:ubiquinone/menaquinone biosynthesis C-methylase UbiE
VSINSKQRAIDVHHEQAELFRSRYEQSERDPFASAFTYGRRKLDAILDKYLPPAGEGKHLLDAGCGSGHNVHTLQARGYQCTGLDAAEGMVQQACELNPDLDIRLGDVETLPYPDNSFDYLISIEVIRYLADPRIALKEFRRVLRPGGIALVTAMPPLTLTGYPLLNHLTARVQLGSFTRVRQYFHSVNCLKGMFAECGFQRTEVEAAFWGPFRNLERLAPRALPKLLRKWEPLDDRLARSGKLQNLSNHLVAAAYL